MIKRGTYWTIGPEVEEFERIVAEYVGMRYCVSFNSGTSALHAIMLAYNIGPGDEVIIPSFTFIATANAPLFVGAKPVFADIEDSTFGLDPEDVKRKITKRTRAIMPIHYGGLPCRIRELKEIAEDHKILLIEDAAESLGASIDHRKVGSFGDAAMFSFCGNKVITTGEGGVIVTNSREIYKRLKMIRSHGRSEFHPSTDGSMDYVILGYNWRVSSIIAALGISQMRKIDRIIEMRREKAEYMTRNLSEIDMIETPNAPNGYFHIYQMYTIRVKGDKEMRDALKNYLAEKNITSKIYFKPVHLTRLYMEKFGLRRGYLPVTESISDRVLTLPLYPTMTVKEMEYIVKSVKEFFEG